MDGAGVVGGHSVGVVMGTLLQKVWAGEGAKKRGEAALKHKG